MRLLEVRELGARAVARAIVETLRMANYVEADDWDDI